MASVTIGVSEAEVKENIVRAEKSENFPANGKKPMLSTVSPKRGRKPKPMSPDLALAFLQSTVSQCQDSGWKIGFVNLKQGTGQDRVGIVLGGVYYCSGCSNLIPGPTPDGEKCEDCR